MILSNLRLERDSENAQIIVDIESIRYGSDTLWFSIPAKYENALVLDRYDAFLVGMLYPAMVYGEDIEVRGKVSERLLFNINTYVIPLLKAYSPLAQKIKVT